MPLHSPFHTDAWEGKRRQRRLDRRLGEVARGFGRLPAGKIAPFLPLPCTFPTLFPKGFAPFLHCSPNRAGSCTVPRNPGIHHRHVRKCKQVLQDGGSPYNGWFQPSYFISNECPQQRCVFGEEGPSETQRTQGGRLHLFMVQFVFWCPRYTTFCFTMS